MTPPRDSSRANNGKIRRVIGPWGTVAVVAGSMVGIGIFLSPRIVAEQMPTLGGYLFVWLFGGFVALCGAVAYAELGSIFPRSGGDYVFLNAAFGRSTAVAGGWLLFLGVFCGSVATMSVAVCEYQLPVLLGPVVDVDWSAELVALGPLSITGVRAAGLALLLSLTVLNVLGTKVSERAQILLSLVPIAILLLISVWVLVTGPHDTAIPATESFDDRNLSPVAGFTGAFLAVYFAYAGWNAVAYIAGEVKDYEKNLPIGLIGGTLLVSGVYAVMAAAFVAVLGMGGLTQAMEAGTATASALWGDHGELVAVAIIAIGLLGSINATIFAGSRIAAAMGRDGVLPEVVGKWGPRSTPEVALWLQAAVSILLVVSGTFEALLELTSVAMLLLGSLVVIALFLLRQKHPDIERPYRAMGYPVLPAIFVVVSLSIVVISLYRAVEPSSVNDMTLVERWFPLLGIALFALIFAIHRILSTRSSSESQPPEPSP